MWNIPAQSDYMLPCCAGMGMGIGKDMKWELGLMCYFGSSDFSDIDILKVLISWRGQQNEVLTSTQKFREALVIALLNDDGPKDQNLGMDIFRFKIYLC
jgi:hypothetical protein